MREIKFRAWDNTKQEWTLNIMECISSRCADIWLEPALKSHEVIIEQYTGLKDKNGKEIYEGDILKFEDSVFEIGWLNKGARFGFYPVKNCNFGMGFSLSRSDVIGNIHENPELIGKERE